ncbi:CBS domain-containing protein [Trinickia terrae]|uniref:CBS domain-containing protein n=1 Tax=Trinickia terrae TaxID=2571161 RepID=A0A4U1IFN5_9BURK|nr:CBS domain-containing protein [Trinickia terrae]TKC92564.1 CBS domain-containing protein [Trinickia terrae]
MRALDIMTTPVITATTDMTIQAAARRLADHHISGMPVVDADGKMIGIVSAGDLLHRAELGTGAKRRPWWLDWLSSTRDLAATYVKEHGHFVGDVMKDRVISITEDIPLKEIADILERRHIKRVPVLKDGALIGIVSRSNLIRALGSLEPPHDDGSHDDAELRAAIVLEMHGQRWGLPKGSVLVKDGVVHLWGVINTEEEGHAIRVAAESVPGVRRVESHLVYPGVNISL